jgi:hypothetical protein
MASEVLDKSSPETELLMAHLPVFIEVATIVNGQIPISVEGLHQATQPWTRGDHWTPEKRHGLSRKDEMRLRDILRGVNLVDAVEPPRGEYDHIVVLGGTMLGNKRRVDFAKALFDSGHLTIAAGGDISVWAGQRLREKREDHHLYSVLQMVDQDHSWLRNQNNMPDMDRWQRPFATEREMGQLALMASLGDINWRYSRLHVGLQPKIEGVPYRGVSSQEFLTSYGKAFILNAAAVDRPQGEPRHTSVSTAREWLRDFKPKPSARVALINSNPHIARVDTDIKNTFALSGRGDIQLESGGPAAIENAPIEVYLGEVARIIHNGVMPA